MSGTAWIANPGVGVRKRFPSSPILANLLIRVLMVYVELYVSCKYKPINRVPDSSMDTLKGQARVHAYLYRNDVNSRNTITYQRER